MPTTEDIALAVVIRSNLALVQRRYRHERGFVYEFPGGSPETGESWCEAASRELFEETGLVELICKGQVVKPSIVGSQIAFVVFLSDKKQVPTVVDRSRQQIFYWFEACKIPLDDFFSPDVEFIKHDLPTILKAIDV